ncbi:hypothetical protein [Burkholderia anthina]|uniref:hypothetical protein n=1 Tax=Burkholderia anthina TaxID=179879 RepID=UPI00158B5569|nr:hypothetical protein [Burkholderia anthina]
MGSNNAHLRADKFRGEGCANDWGNVATNIQRRGKADLKKKILPTLTNAGVKRLRFILVRNIGVFVGRAVPVVGWVIAANDVTMISIRSVSRYNALVKPEDKVF